jgi:hypothetical protein
LAKQSPRPHRIPNSPIFQPANLNGVMFKQSARVSIIFNVATRARLEVQLFRIISALISVNQNHVSVEAHPFLELFQCGVMTDDIRITSGYSRA